jgi:hypothetical protein
MNPASFFSSKKPSSSFVLVSLSKPHSGAATVLVDEPNIRKPLSRKPLRHYNNIGFVLHFFFSYHNPKLFQIFSTPKSCA